jgi:hypothetical protein
VAPVQHLTAQHPGTHLTRLNHDVISLSARGLLSIWCNDNTSGNFRGDFLRLQSRIMNTWAEIQPPESIGFPRL